MPAHPLEGHDCSAAAPDAVSHCRSVEQMGPNHLHALGRWLTSHEAGFWIMPDASGTVLIPAQALRECQAIHERQSYFHQNLCRSSEGRGV